MGRSRSRTLTLKISPSCGVKRLMRRSGVEKQRRDVGRGHEVLEVAVGVRDFFELHLQLVIDGVQFLVDALQLLFARLELLGGGAVLFVEALQLLVGGAQILVRQVIVVPHPFDAPLGLTDRFPK